MVAEQTDPVQMLPSIQPICAETKVTDSAVNVGCPTPVVVVVVVVAGAGAEVDVVAGTPEAGVVDFGTCGADAWGLPPQAAARRRGIAKAPAILTRYLPTWVLRLTAAARCHPRPIVVLSAGSTRRNCRTWPRAARCGFPPGPRTVSFQEGGVQDNLLGPTSVNLVNE
jgi:hypothetical protein